MILHGQATGHVRTDVPIEMLVMFINSISVDFGKYMVNKAGLQFGDLVTEENIRKLDVRGIANDLVEILRCWQEHSTKHHDWSFAFAARYYAALFPGNEILPILLILEPVMVGCILVAIIVFQEKAEGSLRALRVSPTSSWQYFFSKVIASLTMAIVYAVPLAILTLGLQVDLLRMLLVLLLASYLMTTAGLLVSVFFKDISRFIAPALVVFSFLTLPVTAYFFPTFKLAMFDFMPTYSWLFGPESKFWQIMKP